LAYDMLKGEPEIGRDEWAGKVAACPLGQGHMGYKRRFRQPSLGIPKRCLKA
jgi:hypothetical protein